MIPLSPQAFADAAANLYDSMLGEGLADLRRMPSSVIDEGPQRSVLHYHPAEAASKTRSRSARPVLLVPPLAAIQAFFFFRESLSPLQLAGFGLALGGVMLTRSAPQNKR